MYIYENTDILNKLRMQIDTHYTSTNTSYTPLAKVYEILNYIKNNKVKSK